MSEADDNEPPGGVSLAAFELRAPTAADLGGGDHGGAGPLSEVALPWREALASLDTWRTLAEAPRRAALEELARDLVAADPRHDFAVRSARVGGAALGALAHRASGTEVVAVPGGRFAMGFTADDALAVWMGVAMPGEGEGAADGDGALDGALGRARPAQLVTLCPFLLAQHPSTAASRPAEERDGSAARAAEALGWRLATEAEWEWAAREGGAVRFVGLPASAHPLRPNLAPPVREPTGWGLEGLLDDAEPARSGLAACVALHAAWRGPGRGRTRLALSLPGAPLPTYAEPFAWEATFSGAVAALSARDAGDRERGRRALAALAIHPGEDSDTLASAAIPLLLAAAATDEARVAWLLGLFATIAQARPAARAALAPQTGAVEALGERAPAAVAEAARALLEALGG